MATRVERKKLSAVDLPKREVQAPIICMKGRATVDGVLVAEFSSDVDFRMACLWGADNLFDGLKREAAPYVDQILREHPGAAISYDTPTIEVATFLV